MRQEEQIQTRSNQSNNKHQKEDGPDSRAVRAFHQSMLRQLGTAALRGQSSF